MPFPSHWIGALQSQAPIPHCIYSTTLFLWPHPSLSLWLHSLVIVKLCTLEGTFNGLSFLCLMYRPVKKNSITISSGIRPFCSNSQNTFSGLCYSAFQGLQTHLCKGYPSFLVASPPLPFKHFVTLVSSFTCLTPLPMRSSLLLHLPPAVSSMLSPTPALLAALWLLVTIY